MVRHSDATALQQRINLISSCCWLKQILQILTQVLLSGLQSDSNAIERIVQWCTLKSFRAERPLDFINQARLIVKFTRILKPFSWNNVIRGYATSNCGSERETLWVYLDMRRLGINPNQHTFPFLLKASSSFSGLIEGRQIHADVVKHGCNLNVYVQNTLLHLYGSCKKIEDSYKVFDEMSTRTLVSWNSMILASMESSWLYDSIELFIRMRISGFEPDQITMVIVLSACAELGNLTLGKWIHSQVIEKCLVINTQLGTALVDMYGKSGDVNYARFVFDRMLYRNVWTWTSMIIGYAQHGYAIRALALFKEMRSYLIKPNHVTFLGVLCACSHVGLVEDAKLHFHEMKHVYGIKPMMAHYGAMVDVLGRAGLLEEAYSFIIRMPIKADATTWRTMLSACNIHDKIDCSRVGKRVRERLVELEPKRSGNLVMIANSYAEVGQWEKAEHLRSRMRVRGLKKIAGESCLEIGGCNYRFLSGDCSCIGCEEILPLLFGLNVLVKMVNVSIFVVDE